MIKIHAQGFYPLQKMKTYYIDNILMRGVEKYLRRRCYGKYITRRKSRNEIGRVTRLIIIKCHALQERRIGGRDLGSTRMR